MYRKATRVMSGGRQLTYLQLVESYREGGRVRQRVIAKLGREDGLDPGAIARLVRSLAKYADVDVGAGNVLDDVELLPVFAFAFAYRGLWRVENAFRTLKTPLELRPLFHTSEPGIRGHVQACVLAYALVRVIEDRLDAAGLDLNAKEALQERARIQRAPLYRAGVTVTKTSSPTDQQRRLLAAIGAPLPERHAAV